MVLNTGGQPKPLPKPHPQNHFPKHSPNHNVIPNHFPTTSQTKFQTKTTAQTAAQTIKTTSQRLMFKSAKSRALPKPVLTIRDGQGKEVLPETLVPGDVIAALRVVRQDTLVPSGVPYILYHTDDFFICITPGSSRYQHFEAAIDNAQVFVSDYRTVILLILAGPHPPR